MGKKKSNIVNIERLVENEALKQMKEKGLIAQIEKEVDIFFKNADVKKAVHKYLKEYTDREVQYVLNRLENGDDDPYGYEPEWWDDELKKKFDERMGKEMKAYLETEPLLTKAQCKQIVSKLIKEGDVSYLLSSNEMEFVKPLVKFFMDKLTK